MNPKLLTAFLVAMGSLSGCVVYDRDGSDGSGGGYDGPAQQYLQPGNVTVSWAFGGFSCNDIPDIKSVKVSIPGESLQNDGVYPCLVSSYPGIELHDFAGGAYTYTVEAFNYSNERVYSGGGTFTVDGDVRVNIDLTPAGRPTSYAYVGWSFPENNVSANPNCSEAGAAFVDVQIDEGPVERFACVEGITGSGIQTPYLYPGTHDITLTAVNSSGYAYYRTYGTLKTFSGSPVSSDYLLNWAVGGAVVRWTLTNGSVTQSCAQAGIDTVRVNFQDEAGNMVYGNAGDPMPCTSALVTYDFLQPGTYKVFLQGTGAGGTFYLSNAGSPPRLTVRAGEWPPESAGTNVTMYRQ